MYPSKMAVCLFDTSATCDIPDVHNKDLKGPLPMHPQDGDEGVTRALSDPMRVS